MSVILLVRHGQASFGADNYDRLSERGHEQAALLGHHWQESGQRLDAIYSGTLQRQIDTARGLHTAFRDTLGRAPDATLPEFDEFAFQPLLRAHAGAGNAVDWSLLARDRAAFHRYFESALGAWTRGELTAPGTETWPDFQARCARGLARIVELAGRGRVVAVCSSAGAIGGVLQQVLGLDDANTIRLQLTLYNCSVTRLLTDGRVVSLESFNGIPHLERPGRTSLITHR